jgi:hypothetical protein
VVADLLWDSETTRSVARLHKRLDAKAPPFSRDDLAGLPDPVVRYFEFALTPGQPLVRNARLGRIGEFAMRVNSWSPFTVRRVLFSRAAWISLGRQDSNDCDDAYLHSRRLLWRRGRDVWAASGNRARRKPAWDIEDGIG